MNIDQIAIYVMYQWNGLNKFYKVIWKAFFKFQFCFQIIGRKAIKYSNHVNIDRSAMRYISMDLTRQALHTIGKVFFSNFGII